MTSSLPIPLRLAVATVVFMLGLGATFAEQTITGVVFDDRNSDGVRQPGEAGLSSVVLSNQIDVVHLWY